MVAITVSVETLRRAYLPTKRRTGTTGDLDVTYYGVPVRRMEFARYDVVRYLAADGSVMGSFQGQASIDD